MYLISNILFILLIYSRLTSVSREGYVDKIHARKINLSVITPLDEKNLTENKWIRT
jgi:hypothetical protein